MSASSISPESDRQRYARLLEESRAIQGVSLGKDAWRRLRKNRVAMLSLWFLVGLGVLAFLTPLLPLQPPRRVETWRQFAGPGQCLERPVEKRPAREPGTDPPKTPFRDYFGDLDPVSGALLKLRIGLFGEWSIPSLCGTDKLGRDLLSRLFWGARISLAVGVVATLVSLVIGVSFGAIAGYLGGQIDNLMMRLVDVLYSIPFIFVVIFLITILSAETTREVPLFDLPLEHRPDLESGTLSGPVRGAFGQAEKGLDTSVTIDAEKPGQRWRIRQRTGGDYLVEVRRGRLLVFTESTGRLFGASRMMIFFFLVGAIYWLTMARVVRGQVISLKNEQFVEAARTLGASRPRIIFVHLVPNLLSVVIVYLTLTIPRVMLFEAFLSFLGLGVEPPDVSWGLLANEGIKVITPIRIYWWLVLFPGLALGLTLFALNFLGDGLRDALDPRLKNR